jgi:pimeloyl-ACP methyl ester carboxylesterase
MERVMLQVPARLFNSVREAAMAVGGELWRGARQRTGQTRDELARRAALARQPAPDGVVGPPLRFLLGELGMILPSRLTTPPVPKPTPAAQRPRPVMLLPGFGAHPMRMRRMLRALQEAGHDAHEWGLGFNLGPTPANFGFLMSRVGELARSAGEPVALVGWSLGGLFAREIAKQRPDCVAGVITMGTPFSGDRRANNAWRAYQAITGHEVDAPPIPGDFSAKPPCPTIALWSPRDGIVAPRSACGRKGERDRAIALRCSHLGFANHPTVIAEVLRQLDLL